ncbi:nucleoid-associated protein [Mycobacteroides chelonae]|uniref:nucleoid-associated protein n=1 Tax=Mycobacteroides chelonae TaxID=1774 RepID=UPI0012FF9D4D|nr:nucleoid-associated protein [Mycobacteroides chelonae]MBV0919497.1 nucleoid-associated protein [Mycobacteroides chelonae]
MSKTFDTGSMEVKRWVIHEIPQAFRAQDNIEPTLSKAVSPYDDEVARFFERKIGESFRKSKHQIQPADGESLVPAAIAQLLGDPSDGVLDLSTALAEHLFAAQSGAMSAGLLVVMEGLYQGSTPIIATLKLEKEEGARAANTEIGGMSTFSVEYMRDLFLTGRTRVFKVSVFMLDSEDPPQLKGWISDPQSRGAHVADFFLHSFLGCQLVDDPKIVTRQFHVEAENFINTHVADPAKKARYETALVAELQGNSSEVGIRSFCDNYLDLKDRAPFEKALVDAGVAQSFVKDTQLIKLARVQYEFVQGVKVSYPVDAPDGVVTVSGRDDGKTELQVVDDLKKLRSRA